MNKDIKSIILNFIPAFLAAFSVVFLQYYSGWFEEVESPTKLHFFFNQGCYLLIVIASVCFLISISKIIQIKFNSQNYFREEFSLRALSACLWLVIIFVCSSILKLMPWHILRILFYSFKNEQIPQITIPISEYLFVSSILLIIFLLLSQIYQKWRGKKSTNQYEKEQNSQDSSFISEGISELLRIRKGKDSLEVYSEEKFNQFNYEIKPGTDFVYSAWKDQACELIRLSSSSYAFDLRADWYDSQQCWVGENTDTKKLVVLFPVQSQFSSSKLQELKNIAQNVKNTNKKQIGEIIVAFQKESDRIATPNSSDRLISFETEKSLLDNLVNFRDYYNEINKRVENQRLPAADWTLNDAYVPSNFMISDDKKSSQTIEEYLQEWLHEPSKKQIALLGEYGQGKSTAALMFVYHMIEQAKQNKVRVPILIELRGKSPRNLTTQEILATWAAQYRIDAQALLRLHIAGRLLLIFEGFDEMALIGNFEARLQHFRRLWEFCYPQAKILITGRPNFFLDDEEMRLALGISQPTGDNHYCEAIRLAPFSIEQIEESLRQQKPEIKEQICSVAKTNSGFLDLIARPSLLHVVSVIWEKEKLGEKVDTLNSAYVMERFVKNSYRRQGLKAGTTENQSRRYFMALNTPEREYFMSGIAAYMVSKKLSNQISALELNKLIEDLIDAIPDSVSTSVDAISGEDRRPLKNRIKEPQEDIEHIRTDVRTCGLLVDDPAVSGTFKFGHKSFMEYLFAATISNSMTESQKQDTQAILKTTSANISQILDLPVSIDFLSEIIIQNAYSLEAINNIEQQNLIITRLILEKCLAIKKIRLLEKILIIDFLYMFFYQFFCTQTQNKVKRFGYFMCYIASPITLFILGLAASASIIFSGLLESFIKSFVSSDSMILGMKSYFILVALVTTKLSVRIFLRHNYSKQISLWIQLSKKIGIEDNAIHKVIGTIYFPWIKNFEFSSLINSVDSNIINITNAILF